MPTGKGRREPPPGYMTASDAGNLLGSSAEGFLLGPNLVEAGRLHRHSPPEQKHGYYLKSEVDAILEADRDFFEAKLHKVRASFAQTTPADIHSLRELAVRLFGEKTISEDIRRSWVEKEPRGNYIIKLNDTQEVVAYFYVQSLSHERIVHYLHECKGSTVTPDEIRRLEPGQHELIVAGIGRDPRADRQYMAVMLHKFSQDMVTWAQEGIEVTKLYAYSETMEGIFLCFKLGMELTEKPRNVRGRPHYKFVLDIEKSNHPLVSAYKMALAEYKQAHEQVDQTPVSLSTKLRTRTTQPLTGTRPILPSGWASWTQFIERHGIDSERRPLKALHRADYCQSTEYMQVNQKGSGSVLVKCALDPVAQRQLLEALRGMEIGKELKPCEVIDCPCKEIFVA